MFFPRWIVYIFKVKPSISKVLEKKVNYSHIQQGRIKEINHLDPLNWFGYDDCNNPQELNQSASCEYIF